MSFKEIFKDCRIAVLVGNKNCGKTNNLFFLLQELRKENKDLMIYAENQDKYFKVMLHE